MPLDETIVRIINENLYSFDEGLWLAIDEACNDSTASNSILGLLQAYKARLHPKEGQRITGQAAWKNWEQTYVYCNEDVSKLTCSVEMKDRVRRFLDHLDACMRDARDQDSAYRLGI